jgi:hypothetical protein
MANTLIFVGFGTGIAGRFAALMLAGYCVISALLWKQFWKQPDFSWRGKSQQGGNVRDLMERLWRIASPLRLCAEAFDPNLRRRLGKFSQAFPTLR